jgi:hypothetical protein
VETLFHDSETARLRFDSDQDALDFAAHSVRDAQDWLAFNRLDFVDRYKSGELEIVLHIIWGTGAKRHEYHLIFGTIPCVIQRHLEKSSSPDSHMLSNKHGESRDDSAVLIRITGCVNCAQEVIPSEVRLEPKKQRLDFARQVCTSPHGFNHIGQRSGKREPAVLGIRFPSGGSDGVSSIVERSPKVDNKFSKVVTDVVQFPSEFTSWFDFVNLMVSLISVRFDNAVVGVTLDKRRDFPLEIKEMFFSPVEFAM